MTAILELAERCRERLRELEEHPWPSEIKPLLKFAEQRLARAVEMFKSEPPCSGCLKDGSGVVYHNPSDCLKAAEQEIRALAEALGVDDE